MTHRVDAEGQKLVLEFMRQEKLLAGTVSNLEASVYTGDPKRIEAAHLIAVEAFRDCMDAKVAIIQHSMKTIFR